MVGEVGEMGARQVEIMGDYTGGEDKLHMAYSFAMLSHDRSARHFRSCIQTFKDNAPDGCPSWSFSNHDVQRHVTRWTPPGGDADAVAKQSIALLTAFPGSLGLFQGEELGQTETDIALSEVQDTANIRFWPEYKGRDGCRTPMVWDADAPNAGFSDGTPWLPVKPPQAARALSAQDGKNDSVLAAYRAALSFRKGNAALRTGATSFHELPEPLLGIRRTAAGSTVTAVFNLSDTPQHLTLTGTAHATGPQLATLAPGTLTLPAYGHIYLEEDGTLTLTPSKVAATA